MSYLSDLQWKATNLNVQKGEVENELNMLRGRASEVKKLVNNLTTVGDDKFSDVNWYADKLTEAISTGVQGGQGSKNVTELVAPRKETSTLYDGKLASGLSEFKRELSRVNTRIDELESQLASIKSAIWSVNDSIRSEQRKIAEEEAQKRWESIFGE